MTCAYRFVLEVRTLNGDVLFSEALEPDWEPAVQGTRLVGLRTLGVRHHDGGAESSVVPVWHAAAGQPMVQWLRVRMTADGHDWFADFQTNEYFAGAAHAVVAARLAAGQLGPDDRVRYAVAAYPAEALRPVSHRPRLQVVDRPQPLDVRDRAFSALAARAIACGESDPADVEVVLPETLLDEVCALTEAAGERETGGILIGHLCRDENRGDVGLEITAQIPARHAVSAAEKLTFTSETWTDVRGAVALRKQGELLVGWWHSHPAFSWCARCPIERQRVCQLASGFLSADDKALHRSVFAGAYTQALLVTKSVAGLDTRVFGWRGGVLKARGFRVSRESGARGSLGFASLRTAPSIAEAACANESGPPQADLLVVSGH